MVIEEQQRLKRKAESGNFRPANDKWSADAHVSLSTQVSSDTYVSSNSLKNEATNYFTREPIRTCNDAESKK